MKIKYILLFVIVLLTTSCAPQHEAIRDITWWFDGLGYNPRLDTEYEDYFEGASYTGKVIVVGDDEITYVFGEGIRWVIVEIEYVIILDFVAIESIEIAYTNNINHTYYSARNYNYTNSYNTGKEKSKISKTIRSLSINDWVTVLRRLS